MPNWLLMWLERPVFCIRDTMARLVLPWPEVRMIMKLKQRLKVGSQRGALGYNEIMLPNKPLLLYTTLLPPFLPPVMNLRLDSTTGISG